MLLVIMKSIADAARKNWLKCANFDYIFVKIFYEISMTKLIFKNVFKYVFN